MLFSFALTCNVNAGLKVNIVLSVLQRDAAGSVGSVHQINERRLYPEDFIPARNTSGEEYSTGRSQHCVGTSARSQGVRHYVHSPGVVVGPLQLQVL